MSHVVARIRIVNFTIKSTCAGIRFDEERPNSAR